MSYLEQGYDEFFNRGLVPEESQVQDTFSLFDFDSKIIGVSLNQIQGGITKSSNGGVILDLDNEALIFGEGGKEKIRIGKQADGDFGFKIFNTDGIEILSIIDSKTIISLDSKSVIKTLDPEKIIVGSGTINISNITNVIATYNGTNWTVGSVGLENSDYSDVILETGVSIDNYPLTFNLSEKSTVMVMLTGTFNHDQDTKAVDGEVAIFINGNFQEPHIQYSQPGNDFTDAKTLTTFVIKALDKGDHNVTMQMKTNSNDGVSFNVNNCFMSVFSLGTQ